VVLPRFWNGPELNPAAFIGKRAGTATLVLDGLEGPPFDEISSVVVSTDGSSLAYVGRRGDAYSVIWGDRRFESPAKVDSLSLARFGGTLHIAWILHEAAGQSLVIDGQAGRGYEQIGSCMAYDNIGAAKPLYGYEARSQGGWRYVVGEVETPAFTEVTLDSLVLSPEGGILGYAGSAKEGWYFYRGGAREGPYDYAEFLRIGPGGDYLGFGGMATASLVKQGESYAVVLGAARRPVAGSPETNRLRESSEPLPIPGAGDSMCIRGDQK
jgi:hypothetical protein